MTKFTYHPGPHERCTVGTYELHCGDCFQIWAGGEWVETRIELAQDWYLVGLHPNRAEVWDRAQALSPELVT